MGRLFYFFIGDLMETEPQTNNNYPNLKKIQTQIKNLIEESIKTKQNSIILTDKIAEAAKLIINAYKNNKKVLIAGNGGSAADAQHFAGEMVGRFKKERKALPCISLTTDTSIITAIGNDYGFDPIFSRQVEALGNQGDILIIITTSDFNEEDKHSINLKTALEEARKRGMKTIGLYSIKSQKILELTDVSLKVNAKDTPRIQEMHITILHILAELIENELFK